MRRFVIGFVAFLLVSCFPQVLPADEEHAPAKPAPYAKFVANLKPQRGLFTFWRVGAKLYVELAKAQLDVDFIQSAEPATGLGGFGVTPGLPYIAFARMLRFSRRDDSIVISWPNTSFVAPEGSPAARAIEQSVAPSVVAVAPVAAVDEASGAVVFDASAFLGDVLDLQNYLRTALQTEKKPESAYRLDPTRSYFGPSKAFPENVIIEADQTFAAAVPTTIDNVPDPRSVQIKVKYNIAKAPPPGSYMPRLGDDRVGYYPDILLDYGSDRQLERQLHYILRWNLARHPMVYYIGNTVPVEYRDAIRQALLTWNDAFARIGMPNAVEVRDQPDDPAWDSDDIRYNSVHWLTQSNGGGYAQAGLVFDPRSGELMKTSIVLDADLLRFGAMEGEFYAGPSRGNRSGTLPETEYGSGMRASAAFGLWGLRSTGAVPWSALPPNYVQDYVRAIVLHESGHNWGLQHNFIASEAYSAKQLQDKAFTSRFGVANSVMEYAPVNVWPKGTPNGDFFQVTLGPYDYYAIKWGYARVAGASTPQAEIPTLTNWAALWSDPRYRYANDEDVQWDEGHAIDPRVNHWDLTNDNLAWCSAQLAIADGLIRSLEYRALPAGETHDAQRVAFEIALNPYRNCAAIASHYVGAEYLSRAHIGDPLATLPLDPVPADQTRRAFELLDRYLLSERAWRFSPHLLRELVYTEWVTDFPQAAWQYNPAPRHDVPVSTIVGRLQTKILGWLFTPTVLQRVDDLSLKYSARNTMSLSDLFSSIHRAVYGDLSGAAPPASSEIRRNLQQWYVRQLARLVVNPLPNTPFDAQSLARADLVALRGEVSRAQTRRSPDPLTRAHLAALRNVAEQALGARTVVPVQKSENPETPGTTGS